MNPFNGIESGISWFEAVLLNMLMNPFNGIERGIYHKVEYANTPRLLNPFNGIERSLCPSPLVEMLLRIHSMELKVQ